MVEAHYKRGEKIFEQGDEGDAFYVIISGNANVIREATRCALRVWR